MVKKVNFASIGASVVLMFVGAMISKIPSIIAYDENNKSFVGVCPPFFIRDEAGAIINPVKNQNVDMPYSPKQTCGLTGCHNYEKITEGYHFQQGKDEEANEELRILYQWVLSPGQYGGRW